VAAYLIRSSPIATALPFAFFQPLLRSVPVLDNFLHRDALMLVTVGFLLLAILLLRAVPVQRARIRSAFVLYCLSLMVLLLARVCDALHLASASDGLEVAGLFIAGVSIVNVLSVLIFDVCAPVVRLATPRIMRDLLMALGYVGVLMWLLSGAGGRWQGVSISSLVTTSALLTAVIAFSLQDTLGNIMGGLALQMERTINVGDWVRIDQNEGRVKEIRWRHTAIETRNWDTIIYPNSVLMKGHVMVLGRRAGHSVQHRMWVYFNVDFRVAPTDVISTVTDALLSDAIAGVAADPQPQCIVWDFKESFISYAVRYYLTDLAIDDPTNSLVRTRIYFALKRANIPLSIPAHSLFVTEETSARKDLHLEKETAHRVSALRGVELFHALTDKELRTLAERLRFAPFTAGEAMTRQGAQAHWLYIITRGSGEVLIHSEDGDRRRVALLQTGDFFGEIGLMLGIPRTATVRALEDTDCYRLDKEAFQETLHNRPEIAEHISHAMARRRVELEAIRDDLDAETRRHRLVYAQRDIIERITRFFGLSDAAKAGK
jgi:small-conductance mechanosensitive channel/CRP-like cAMP-binding protein